MYYPQVYTGKIEISEKLSASAINKRMVDGSLRLTSLGLEDDEQAETRVHGGPDRIILANTTISENINFLIRKISLLFQRLEKIFP